MKGFKGFNKGLICRDKQYAENTVFEEKEASLCNKGIHFCENPIDVFRYYPPSDSEYAEVESPDDAQTQTGDDKVCTTKLKINTRISLPMMIDAGVNFIMSRITKSKKPAATNTGNRSAATNTGYRSAATNTGNSSAATNTGYRSAATNTGNSSAATNTGNSSAATNTGDSSAATNTGYSSAATNTGDRSAATNTGNSSAATNTGYRSAATNTGYSSAATNTGYRSAAMVKGINSFAIATGVESKARGELGCYLVLAEYDKAGNMKAKMRKVDGKHIKPNTFYTMKNNKFIVVKDN
ncbi:MAG: hypothetical protein WC479_10190 [Candidatus Izemoplasmatales bacterium]